MRYYFLLGGFAYITDTDTFTRTNLEITDSLLVELNGTGAIEVQSTFDYVQDEGYLSLFSSHRRTAMAWG